MRILGLMAWLLFTLTFVVALRSRLLAELLGGFARQHRIHHWLGLSTGLFVLLHVYFESFSEPEMIFSLEDPYLITAWMSVLLLTAGLAFSFVKRLAHRKWLVVHWSLLVAFIAAFFHGKAFLNPEFPDEVIFYVSALAGLLSIAFMVVLRLYGSKWSVVGVKELSPTLYEIGLQSDRKRGPGFKAGSIVFAQFGQGFSRAWHPFSIASCQHNPILRLLIKSAGMDTSHLRDLRAGDTLTLRGPFADFSVQPAENQVWIAGGIGIAPFLGLTRCLDFGTSGQIRLIHYQNLEEPGLAREFEEFHSRYPQFRWKSKVTTHADFVEIQRWMDEMERPVFLICGPESFMKSARKFLIRLGIDSSRIKTEEFSPW